MMKALQLSYCLFAFLDLLAISSSAKADETADRALLLKLAANYEQIPKRLSTTYTYSAIAGRDYSLFHHETTVLENEQHRFKHPVLFDKSPVAKGTTLAVIDGSSRGTPDSFVFHFQAGDASDPAWHGLQAADGLFQTASSLIRYTPGAYVDLSRNRELPITPAAQLITTLPIYIPGRPGAMPSERSVAYADLLRNLASDHSTFFQEVAGTLTVRAVIDRHPNDTPGSELSREVTLIIDSDSLSLKDVRFHMTDREPGHDAVQFPDDIIAFSHYGQVGSAQAPAIIQLTTAATLYDFGGVDPEQNAKALGEDVTQLRDKVYEVLTHRYDISSVQPLEASELPGFTLNRGETVMNRMANTYIHLPQAMAVSDIPTFINQSAAFTNHSFATPAPTP